MAVEGETQGIHEDGFAATVEAANQDDGAIALGGEVNGLPPLIKAKVLQIQLLKNHAKSLF